MGSCDTNSLAAKFHLGKVAHRSPHASVVAYQGRIPKLDDSVFLADGARIIGDVAIARGVSVWFNVVVRGDVNTVDIGVDTNIQDGTIVHCTYQKHATRIGARVSIAHLAMIHGCDIEDDALIGMRAVVMDGAVIGAGSIVAAGSVVTEGVKIPPGMLAVGTPAKAVRPLNEPEIAMMRGISGRYIDYQRGFDFR